MITSSWRIGAYPQLRLLPLLSARQRERDERLQEAEHAPASAAGGHLARVPCASQPNGRSPPRRLASPGVSSVWVSMVLVACVLRGLSSRLTRHDRAAAPP